MQMRLVTQPVTGEFILFLWLFFFFIRWGEVRRNDQIEQKLLDAVLILSI